MARTTFSGPVKSLNGFEGTLIGAAPPAGSPVGPGVVFTAVPTSGLPAPSVALTGGVMMVSDNGVGNNEFCLVVCNGTAWVTATGQPLS